MVENEHKAGMKRSMEKHGLDYSEQRIENLAERDWHSESSTRVNNGHYNGLRIFFKEIGDYDSLLMLLKNPPLGNCPSMNCKSIVLYLRYKTEKKGTEIYYGGNVARKTIIATGGWHANVNLTAFHTAVTAVHQARGQTGTYQEPCPACIKNDETGDRNGCQMNRGNPRLVVSGDPMMLLKNL